MISPLYIKLGAAIIILSLLTGVYFRTDANHRAELESKYNEGYKAAESISQKEKLESIAKQAEKAKKDIADIKAKRDQWRKTAIDLQKQEKQNQRNIKILADQHEKDILQANNNCTRINGFGVFWNELRRHYHYRTD